MKIASLSFLTMFAFACGNGGASSSALKTSISRDLPQEISELIVSGAKNVGLKGQPVAAGIDVWTWSFDQVTCANAFRELIGNGYFETSVSQECSVTPRNGTSHVYLNGKDASALVAALQSAGISGISFDGASTLWNFVGIDCEETAAEFIAVDSFEIRRSVSCRSR